MNLRGPHPPVGDSPDLRRILALPRRPPADLEGATGRALVELMTARLRKPDAGPCRCAEFGRECVRELKPAQAWALYELGIVGGLVGLVGVGHGKMALDFLAPMVAPGCKVAVLLVPPTLREQLKREYLLWSQHWRVPSLVTDERRTGWVVPGAPVAHVVPYSRLSRPESTALLESLKPDLIVSDEVHRLRHPDGAGTGRFLRYCADHEGVRFAGWSGTVTRDGPGDCYHLFDLALGEGSPLPGNPDVAMEWDLAIGAHDWPAPPGALRRLAEGVEDTRAAYRRRIRETRGVVSTLEAAVDASINVLRRPVKTPPKVREVLKAVRDAWTRPDGEELVEALEVAACARQVASGFYYRWVFPRGEAPELIERWFRARKAWNKAVRERLKHRSEHLDSPKLLADAAERAVAGYDGDLPTWECDEWPAWRDVRDQVVPSTDTVWLDDFLARDAAAFARDRLGVVWCDNGAFGRRVAELAGLPYHAGGPGAEARILAEKGDRSIVASIHAHGTGRDGLQRLFREQLVAEPPDDWEQLLGRLHREGFRWDELDTHVYDHEREVRDALEAGIRRARYVEETTGARQKLTIASVCL